jgi:hypothetical protein
VANNVGFRVEGLKKLTRELQALGLDVDDLKGAFSKIASEGAHLAAGFAPKRSGALAGTIRGNNAKNKAVVSAGRGRGVPYAGPINYGWPKRHISAAGFMQKADEAMRPKALAQLEIEINRKIRERGLQ